MKLRSLVLPFSLALTIGCSGNAPLDGRPPDRVANAVDLRRLPPDAQVEFVVGLSLREPTALHKYVASRRSGDLGLQPPDFADLFAPSRQDYARVVSWLRTRGLFITR